MRWRTLLVAGTLGTSIWVLGSCSGGNTGGTGTPLKGTDLPSNGESPDAGLPDGGAPDAGPEVPDAGPWPPDALLDYSDRFHIGAPQSVAFDEGLNLWLLDGPRIGFIRAGDSTVTWTSGVGQARQGFGADTLATGSTVICGGEDGRAYVGYSALDLQKFSPDVPRTYVPWPGQPYYSEEFFAQYQRGDVDAVRAGPDGQVTLEEHLWRTVGPSNANRQVGIHNTNDFHYDEDRSVRACERVTRGTLRGTVFITTNHGATMIQGLAYNSHRHPGWYKQIELPDGSFAPALQCTDMYGLGIGQAGDVLIANEQMFGALIPNGVLEDWDTEETWDGPVPWRFKLYNNVLNDQESWDYWRGFQQVVGGTYYLGSLRYGLWSFTLKGRTWGTFAKVPGLPTGAVTALRATDDGALYIGTMGSGLLRLEPDGVKLSRVSGVRGARVRQILYEPTVTPRMMLVVTEAGVTAIRGP